MTTKAVEIHGLCDERFSPVRDAFARNFEELGDVGAAVAVTIDGKPVIDLWGGVVDKETMDPWRQDTLVTVYSTTKGMTTICAHRLVEQGLLDLNAPVAKYWPEFTQAGKAEVPVHMLLSHRVGLPTVSDEVPEGAVFDWNKMTDVLARQKPFWEPGTKHGYHGLTFGWLVGEVVRRISGKSLGTFFRDEVALPLGLDFHIGVDPKHDARIATMYTAIAPMEVARQLEQLQQEVRERMSADLLAARANISIQGAHNSEAWRRSELPAANGHSDARSLAKVYGALACGGGLDGGDVLSPESIARATIEQAAGPDVMLPYPTRFAQGFWLSSDGNMGPHPGNFGHPGAGGSVGFADPERRIGFGYVMNQMKVGLQGEATTSRSLINALYSLL
jgi:CubicO group peptidase (beta-lactamase class C family)